MKGVLNFNLLLLATIVIGFSSCSKSKDAAPTPKPVSVTINNNGISLDLDDSWAFAEGWKPQIESGGRGVIKAEFCQSKRCFRFFLPVENNSEEKQAAP